MSFNNLEEIRIFNQVVASGGFSAAAATLKLPTNIVSRKIVALETSLGVRLINRTTRKISLTEEGRVLFNRASCLLAEFETLQNELTKTKQAICGSVRLAVRTTTVEFGLLDYIHELMIDHRELKIELLVSDSSPDIVGSGIDLALMIGDLPDSSLIAKKIGEVIFGLCASPKYIATSGPVESIEDLKNHNYILPWQKRSGQILNIRRDDGVILRIAPQSRFQSNDVRTRAGAVYAGLGIGALPISEVTQKVADGILIRVLPKYTLPPIPVWTVKSKNKKDDPKLKLIEHILQSVVTKMGSL